ncbi:hypothetical protein FRX31_025928 [Thalictrum thalictroides]|uniref:Uncharacterized protein n=1 Tax=Thalictrum thalictroides TaxID=46969 RepID=A0A7J6VHW0_THATH|nr:hypothetical protein FRX31_025928 [Thalictrum thalictroides]
MNPSFTFAEGGGDRALCGMCNVHGDEMWDLLCVMVSCKEVKASNTHKKQEEKGKVVKEIVKRFLVLVAKE